MKTFNLDEIFLIDKGFYGWCLDIICEIIPSVYESDTLQNNFTNYMLKPIWRKYQFTNANYNNNERGIDQFKNDFANQLQDVCVEFYSYVKANISHFEGLDKKQDIVKQVNSIITPINATINQTSNETEIASGTTAQNINATLYNDSVWLNIFNTYMSPQRKGEMLNRFNWLFVLSYYDEDLAESEEYQLEVDENLAMGEGNQVIKFNVSDDISSVKVTINKPSTMIPNNIKNGVNIGGVVGNLKETSTYNTERELAMASGNQVVEATGDSAFKKVTIIKPSTLVSNNIRNGVNIGGVVGNYVGGGGGGSDPVIEPLNVTQNGEYIVVGGVDGYNPVRVNVQPTLGRIDITENGIYRAVAPYQGYNEINVMVMSSSGEELTDLQKWQYICGILTHAYVNIDAQTTFNYLTTNDISSMWNALDNIITKVNTIHSFIENGISGDAGFNIWNNHLQGLSSFMSGVSLDLIEQLNYITFADAINGGRYTMAVGSMTLYKDEINYFNFITYCKWND